jgi:hypothetical protein
VEDDRAEEEVVVEDDRAEEEVVVEDDRAEEEVVGNKKSPKLNALKPGQ